MPISYDFSCGYGNDPHVEFFDTITSTSDTARRQAESGEAEGKVIIAGTQTNGRGRGEHKFYSPSGTGLYMSVILRPQLSFSESLLITTAAAVAVCEAIEKLSDKKADIKWVNDVYINGKKVCGILTESKLSSDSTRLDYVILGIGINLYEPANGFPKELENTVAAVFSHDESIKPESLAADVLNRFMVYYDDLTSKMFLDEYKRRMFLLGKTVNVIKGDSAAQAVAVSIDGNLGLRVKYCDGTYEILSSGEISASVKMHN